MEKQKEKITAEGMYEIFKEFFKNDFCHLRDKVDRIYIWIIGLFIALALDLVGLIAILITKK